MAVVHIPHASAHIPAAERAPILLDDSALRRELLVMTDWFTDELFSLPPSVVTTVRFPVSRLVLDPERFLDDDAEPMAPRGMGVVYERTAAGGKLRDTPAPMDRNRLIERYYQPHHHALKEAVAADLAALKISLVIDCHSFPNHPLPYELDQSPDRPDICIGVDSFHTPRGLVDAVAAACQARNWTTAVNSPFAGALVPSDYYQHDRRVHAVMLEVNRRLYMDETTGEQLETFSTVARQLQDLVRSLLPAAAETK